MKIKYVKEPIEDYPECKGGYDKETNTILVKIGVSKLKAVDIIIHEFIHGVIYKVFGRNVYSHYCNLYFDILWIILFDKITKVNKNIKWYLKYYKDARDNGHCVC